MVFRSANLGVPPLDRVQCELEATLDGQGTTKDEKDQGVEDSGYQRSEKDLETIIEVSVVTRSTTAYRGRTGRRCNKV